MQRFLVTLVLVTLVAGAGLFTVSRWPISQPVSLGMMKGDVQRGAYLARASGCVACHTDTERDGAALAGGAPLDTPFGRFVPPNLTPHTEAGIGGWTLDQFAAAIRQGVRPDGEAYYPAFTYEFYSDFSDQQIADLWAALRTVPPVAVAAADHDLRFPFDQRWGLKVWRALYMSPADVTPVLGQSDVWNRGQELVEGATHCAACHTARGRFGGLDRSASFAGNDQLPGGNAAPSIRSDDLLARGWTAANMSYALRTGIMPDGDVFGGSMSEAVAEGTAMLTDDDRAAIATYLLTPPGQTAVPPPSPQSGDAMDDMAGMEGMEG